MSRLRNRLNAKEVSDKKTKGRFSDGGGLYLRVSPTLSKSWVFRWVRGGIENEIGLGAYPDVSLADARKAASSYREHLAQGKNPRSEREKEKQHAKTFGEVCLEFLEAKDTNWTNEKTRWQWQHSLTVTAKSIQKLPIAHIETPEVLRLLKPIWQKTPETAAKTRMRLERVLDYARANGYREGENPARWRGHLSEILSKRERHTVTHHPALPYDDLPAFMEELKGRETLSARALELLILTATRTSEVLKAQWTEFDLDKAVWTIPASRMKTRTEHRIPMTKEVMELVKPLIENRVSDFLFPGQKQGKPLSNLAMEMLLRRMDMKHCTVHGFRSTFRDWCGDKTSFPREIAEAALAHKIGSEVEQAYRRSDALDKRRRLMEAWGDFCVRKDIENVVVLRG